MNLQVRATRISRYSSGVTETKIILATDIPVLRSMIRGTDVRLALEGSGEKYLYTVGAAEKRGLKIFLDYLSEQDESFNAKD